jgi:protein-S-isoprenylcysteine O-methyltransferase Ste14
MGITLVGAVFTLVVPVPAVAIIPWFITRWVPQPAFLGLEALRYVGVALILIGVAMYVMSLTCLGRYGAYPIPPVHCIVDKGVYGWTRNPMYIGAVMPMLGQALYFGSRGMLYYSLGWFLLFQVFEVTYDEPELKKQFGDVYVGYVDRVPRWIPRRPRA